MAHSERASFGILEVPCYGNNMHTSLKHMINHLSYAVSNHQPVESVRVRLTPRWKRLEDTLRLMGGRAGL